MAAFTVKWCVGVWMSVLPMMECLLCRGMSTGVTGHLSLFGGGQMLGKVVRTGMGGRGGLSVYCIHFYYNERGFENTFLSAAVCVGVLNIKSH